MKPPILRLTSLFEERIELGAVLNASRPNLPEAHSWVDHPFPASEASEGCRRCRKKKPRSRYFEIYGGDVWWWECDKCTFKTLKELASRLGRAMPAPVLSERDHAEESK